MRSYHRQIRAAAACGSAAQPSDERGQDRGGLRRLRALFRFGRHAGPSALGGADGISAAMLRVGLLHRRVDCYAEGSRHGARHPDALSELTGLFLPGHVRDLQSAVLRIYAIQLDFCNAARFVAQADMGSSRQLIDANPPFRKIGGRAS